MKAHQNLNNKIYFSGSLQGIKHRDPEFSWKLVQRMKDLGFRVLSEHVAARNQDEQNAIFLEKAGLDRKDPAIETPWFDTYTVEMDWVDEADYLIAVVDGASHGVGMEIMRALLKKERRLNKTKILCLVHKNKLDKLSWMIRGIPKTYENFRLKTYGDLMSALKTVEDFLNTQ